MNSVESPLQTSRRQGNDTAALRREEPAVSLSSKVKPGHLARKAIVYVRQSTVQQVLHHQESTARQYALDQRAVQLGWAPESVVIVDEDQGQFLVAESRAWAWAAALKRVASSQSLEVAGRTVF